LDKGFVPENIMAHTRQLRIQQPEQIRQRLSQSIGKLVHLVMKDNRVIIGTINGINENAVVVTNMRLKDMRISLQEIAEIYVDTLD
jgi:hypothetical protein